MPGPLIEPAHASPLAIQREAQSSAILKKSISRLGRKRMTALRRNVVGIFMVAVSRTDMEKSCKLHEDSIKNERRADPPLEKTLFMAVQMHAMIISSAREGAIWGTLPMYIKGKPVVHFWIECFISLAEDKNDDTYRTVLNINVLYLPARRAASFLRASLWGSGFRGGQ